MHHSQCNKDTHLLIAFDFKSLKFLIISKSGIVYRINKGKVLKEYHSKKNKIDVECQAFARLDSHTNIMRYLGAIGNGFIVLKRGQPL
jgi:hypothetical protein